MARVDTVSVIVSIILLIGLALIVGGTLRIQHPDGPFLISVGSCLDIGGFCVGYCLFATWRCREHRKRHQHDKDLVKTLKARHSTTLMSLRMLKKATNNFAKSSQIGEGGFGTVYSGKLKDGTIVAIKRGKHEGSETDKEQFLNEVTILSQVVHKHLVKLVGCCMESKIAVLVFEFVSNGTLQEYLQGKIAAKCLSWKQRLKIAIQTADALNYLHSTAAVFPVYHRDVKSANILLNDDLDAKVADFGISKLAQQATHVSTLQVRGTFGYIDPEYMISGQFTDRSDVYSLGVVLLELISAKPAINNSALDGPYNVDEASLVHSAKPHIECEDLQPLIDPALMDTYSDAAGKESILKLGKLAMKCVNMRSDARPSMKVVWKDLQTLMFELNGASTHSDSVNGDDVIVLVSESFSENNANCLLHSDGSGIQMSQFS